jgi:Zn finger protein HypA/HybF involved in hydrogenase expression
MNVFYPIDFHCPRCGWYYLKWSVNHRCPGCEQDNLINLTKTVSAKQAVDGKKRK